MTVAVRFRSAFAGHEAETWFWFEEGGRRSGDADDRLGRGARAGRVRLRGRSGAGPSAPPRRRLGSEHRECRRDSVTGDARVTGDAPAEKSWTISAADFGDGANLLSATSNRSAPYVWERITGGDVRVSIGGYHLPLTSMSAASAFASDLSGAEWTVDAEVRAGAVVLVLTAPDQSVATDTVGSVTITNPGSGYTADPTVTFSAPPTGGTTAAGTADIRYGGVASVTVVNGGRGYTSAPTVTFAAPANGTRATGTAKLAESGYDQYQNLHWARQTLAGKQLLVELAD